MGADIVVAADDVRFRSEKVVDVEWNAPIRIDLLRDIADAGARPRKDHHA